MGRPVYFGSGITPKTGDTRLYLLIKRLRQIQMNVTHYSAANDPTSSDTRYTLLRKIDRALAAG